MGFGVAMLLVGALCFYKAHFGRTVLPKWLLWAHLFCSEFTVFHSSGGHASARRVSHEPCFCQAHCFMQRRCAYSVSPNPTCARSHIWGFPNRCLGMGYRTMIARYVAKSGIAQMCLCETKCQRGALHNSWGFATFPDKVSRNVGYRRNLGVFQRPLTLIPAKVSRYNWAAYHDKKIGGVHTSFCQEEGILFQKYHDSNRRCKPILFKSIGVRGRFDSPGQYGGTAAIVLPYRATWGC